MCHQCFVLGSRGRCAYQTIYMVTHTHTGTMHCTLIYRTASLIPTYPAQSSQGSVRSEVLRNLPCMHTPLYQPAAPLSGRPDFYQETRTPSQAGCSSMAEATLHSDHSRAACIPASRSIAPQGSRRGSCTNSTITCLKTFNPGRHS